MLPLVGLWESGRTFGRWGFSGDTWVIGDIVPIELCSCNFGGDCYVTGDLNIKET